MQFTPIFDINFEHELMLTKVIQKILSQFSKHIIKPVFI